MRVVVILFLFFSTHLAFAGSSGQKQATRFTPAPKGVTTNIIYPFIFAKAK